MQARSTLLLLAASFFGQPSFAEAPLALVNVRQVRSLIPQQASSERPVHLRGVVTARSGWKSSFFFQDSSAGISVDRSNDSPEVQAGQLVEILGVTGPGKFAPLVKATTVQILGNAPMPTPVSVTAAQLAGGLLDSQWAVIQGVVRTASIQPVWGQNVLVLELDIGGGTVVTARVRNFSGESWRQLPGAIVSLRGVCGTIFNDRRQYIGSRFFVPSLKNIKVLRSGPTDLFDRPLQTVGDIARFSFGADAFTPIKLAGTVTYSLADGRLYVQDGSEGLLVQTSHRNPIPLGSQVELVGYAREGDYSPSLESATLHVLGTGRQVKPVDVSASRVIIERDGFPSSPYDSLLIRLSGILMQVIPGTDEQTLILQDGNKSLTARLATPAALGSLPPLGSLVQVTGICATKVDIAREPKGFRVLLRSTSDVVVLKSAPWWNEQHAKMVVVAMGFALVGAVLFGSFRRESALKQLSLSDPLTGVYNRRGFVLLAEQQWKIAQRSGRPMLLFYIDVDKFKLINDTLGHKQGDIALQRVATLLQECFRSTDIVGRLGGDEFAVIACDSQYQSTVHLQNRLADIVEESNRRSSGSIHLSLSVGALLCDQSMGSLSLEELLSRTDALMYEKKASQHGKVVITDAYAKF